MNSTFQRPDVAVHFVSERRRSIPYHEDQLQLLLRLIDHYRPDPRRVVDLGCGNGIVGATVLGRYPGASGVFIDHSEPMLQMAHRLAAEYLTGVELFRADLEDGILELPGVRGADVIVSGYAIHHLPNERKRALYSEIFEALSPGGLFINTEHVASASTRAEALFDEMMIESQAKGRKRPVSVVAAEHHARPDKADNILESFCVQMAWLEEIGFTEVDCYFKFLELAMFGGVKPL